MCTPTGSRFSIEQTTTQLPAASHITSSSSSCQPATERSTRTWPIGLAARPASTRAANSARVDASPPPVPPSVKAGRTTAGSGHFPSCASEVTTTDSGTGSPAAVIASRKASRSSARRIASTSAPISSVSPSRPDSASSTARLSAVWPPSVGRSASGRSRSMIAASVSESSGSR